jgi:glutamate mutase epsilon subunit
MKNMNQRIQNFNKKITDENTKLKHSNEKQIDLYKKVKIEKKLIKSRIRTVNVLEGTTDIGEKTFVQCFEEICSVLDLVEELKLNEKLGL